MRSKNILYVFGIIFIVVCSQYVYGAFNNDVISPVAAAMGSAFTGVDKTSGVFYNPAITGVLASDSILKADVMYENRYGIDGYDYYSGAMVLTGVSVFKLFRFGVSGYYENAETLLSEQNVKFSVGTTLMSAFKHVYISVGMSVGYYGLSFSGFQEDGNDSALGDENYIDADSGLYVVYDNIRIGIVSPNMLNSDLRNNKLPIRIGFVYDLSQYAAMISADFEPVRDLNDYNRSWLKIGSFELGKNIYPLFKLGIEKTVKNIFTIRVGLRDFMVTGGLGIAIKGFQLNYAFISNHIGITHLIGVSIKRL